jgi:hypothetical protein
MEKLYKRSRVEKSLLEKSEYDYIWETNVTIGMKLYKNTLKEIRKNKI